MVSPFSGSTDLGKLIKDSTVKMDLDGSIWTGFVIGSVRNRTLVLSVAHDFLPIIYVIGLKITPRCQFGLRQKISYSKYVLIFILCLSIQILEMDTYRNHDHFMSDPGSTYRTRDEISGIRQERDPIERIRKLILAHDIATEKELEDIEKEKRKEVDEAIAQAKESPMPDPSELFTNVCVKGFGIENVKFTMIQIHCNDTDPDTSILHDYISHWHF
ncbi:hypothetical protein DCAR_0518587 [Daucus carota subsp. sativus]|uniref:Dehydrogenase E1 component domain-containing protein n=1 Tax=Daucus carota subsp. sativus TaxID=79200 RepID=A0AAF1AYB7_DAUCS|nr:hypothetical protein DCAR_0518587 [Daucus carota subsp. sativus]